MDGTPAATLDNRAKTVRGMKGKPFQSIRNALASPYDCKWPELESGVTPMILEEIKGTFQALQSTLAKRKSKNRKCTEKRKAVQVDEDAALDKQKKSLRSQLALGVNEVTRSLEKGHLRLVMVCRSSKPEIMTSHLCALSATRQCPAIAVFNLSSTLAPLLNMKTVLAVGFKKPKDTQDSDISPAFDKLVAAVTEHCPPVKVPWLERMDLPPKVLTEIISKATFRGKKALQVAPSVEMDVAGCTVDGKQEQQVVGEMAIGDTDKTANPHDVPDKGYQKASRKVECKDTLSSQPCSVDKELVEVAPRELVTKDTPECTVEVSSRAPSKAAKKRKFEDVLHSPEKDIAGTKRQRIQKMPYVPTSVKSVKIISKELKGKKKKRGKKN